MERALVILKIIEMLMARGVPSFIQWEGEEGVDFPTVEKLERLKVKTMAEKREDYAIK